MERGPLALFGAIVAVGLGPAMWLGTQFGQVSGSPSRPPAVTVQQNDGRGGVGGAAPENPVDLIKTTPKANVEPLAPAVKPQPRKSSPTPSASTTADPSPAADDDDNSTPPADPSTEPSDNPSTGGGSGNGDDGNDSGSGSGNDGTGSGGSGGTGNGSGTGTGGGAAPPSPPAGSEDPAANAA